MKLFDVNAGFGGRESVQDFSQQALLAQLDRAPVSRAFVHGYQGAFDHISANDAAFSLAASDSKIHVCGSIDPRDVFTWNEEIDRCLSRGVRLFKLFPAKGNWSVDSIFPELVMERLAGTGSSLFVDATESGLPTHLARLAESHDVPVIFAEARYFPLTEMIPLAQRFPQVYIETSRLTSPGGIARCAREVGADRLLYGSGMPRYPAHVAWRLLESAPISDSERQMVAYGNACRMLGLEPGDGREPNHAPIDFTKCIDVHLHDKFPGAPFPPFGPEQYEAEMEANGVTGGICSSVTAIMHDLEQGNDEVAALLGKIDRLRGYVVVDPRYPEISRRELKRLETDERFVGVKIHCSYSATPTGANAMSRLFDDIAPYQRPVLIHNLGTNWPEELGSIARRYPRLPIIAAHAGYGDGPTPTHDAALRVAAYDNIYLEFCSTHLAPGAIRRGIDSVGIGRILFGSDFPLISLPSMRFAYEDADLTNEESIQIHMSNPLRLFPSLEKPR